MGSTRKQTLHRSNERKSIQVHLASRLCDTADKYSTHDRSRRWNPALKQEDDDASVDEHSDYCSSTIYSKTTALEHARICELFDALPFRDAPFTSSGPVITCKVVVEDPAIASALRAKSRLYDSGVSMPDLEDIYNERRTKKLNDPDNESIDSIDALNDAASMLCHRPIEEGSGYIFGYPDEIQPKNPGAIREGLHSIMRSTKSIINKTFAMMRK